MPSSFNIKENLSKLNILINNTKSDSVVRVGILSDTSRTVEGGKSSGMTNAEIGLIHEEGSLSKNIPKRSWLKGTLEIKSDVLLEQSENIIKANMLSRGGSKRSLKRIGIVAEAIIQGAFTTGGYGEWDELSPKTVKNKGSSAILIDTGEFRRSISSAVVKKKRGNS